MSGWRLKNRQKNYEHTAAFSQRAASGKSPLGHLLRRKYVIFRSRPPSTAADRAATDGNTVKVELLHVVDLGRGAVGRVAIRSPRGEQRYPADRALCERSITRGNILYITNLL